MQVFVYQQKMLIQLLSLFLIFSLPITSVQPTNKVQVLAVRSAFASPLPPEFMAGTAVALAINRAAPTSNMPVHREKLRILNPVNWFEGMFDVEPAVDSSISFSSEYPPLPKDWREELKKKERKERGIKALFGLPSGFAVGFVVAIAGSIIAAVAAVLVWPALTGRYYLTKHVFLTSRRGFLMASVGAFLVFLTGCQSFDKSQDKVTALTFRWKKEHPQLLNYSLERYQDLALKYSPELKRIFLEYVTMKYWYPIKTAGESDIVLPFGLDFTINALGAFFSAGGTMVGSLSHLHDNLPGVVTVDGSTLEGKKTLGPNSHSVWQFNNLPLATPLTESFNLQWTWNFLGHHAAEMNLEKELALIRLKAKTEMIQTLLQVENDFYDLLLKQQIDLRLKKIKSLYDALGQNKRDLDYQIAKSNLDLKNSDTKLLFGSVQIPRETVLNPWTLRVKSDSKKENIDFELPKLDEFDAEICRQNIEKNSRVLFQVQKQLDFALEVIAAAKKNAIEPKLSLSAALEPAKGNQTTSIFSLGGALRVTNEKARAEIIKGRLDYFGQVLNQQKVSSQTHQKVRTLAAQREYLFEIVRLRFEDYQKAKKAMTAVFEKNQVEKTKDQINLLEAEMAFMDAKGAVEKLERIRQAAEGNFLFKKKRVDDAAVLEWIKKEVKHDWKQYLSQQKLYPFHDFFGLGGSLKSLLPWMIPLLGVGVASATYFSAAGILFSQAAFSPFMVVLLLVCLSGMSDVVPESTDLKQEVSILPERGISLSSVFSGEPLFAVSL